MLAGRRLQHVRLGQPTAATQIKSVAQDQHNVSIPKTVGQGLTVIQMPFPNDERRRVEPRNQKEEREDRKHNRYNNELVTA